MPGWRGVKFGYQLASVGKETLNIDQLGSLETWNIWRLFFSKNFWEFIGEYVFSRKVEELINLKYLENIYLSEKVGEFIHLKHLENIFSSKKVGEIINLKYLENMFFPKKLGSLKNWNLWSRWLAIHGSFSSVDVCLSRVAKLKDNLKTKKVWVLSKEWGSTPNSLLTHQMYH